MGSFRSGDEMWHDLLIAIALLMVIEGILPFLSPHLVRRMMLNMANSDDRSLRIGGLTSMVLGVVLLYWLR